MKINNTNIEEYQNPKKRKLYNFSIKFYKLHALLNYTFVSIKTYL